MSYSNYQSRRLPGFLRYSADLVRFRHLCWNLVASDLRARFRRSSLGILWAVIQPLAYSLIIAWAWGTIFESKTYWQFAVYVFSGMLVWEYFTNTVTGSLDGLLSAVGYLRQSRVPFFIFQARVPLSGIVTFFAGLIGLIVMLAALQMLPAFGVHTLLVAAFPFMLVAFFLPVAVIFSIIGAQFRDLRHIVTIALQALFFLSPVMIDRPYFDDPRLALLQYANPIVPIIDMLRGPMIEGRMWTMAEIITVSSWGVVLWAACFIVAIRAGRKIVFAL